LMQWEKILLQHGLFIQQEKVANPYRPHHRFVCAALSGLPSSISQRQRSFQREKTFGLCGKQELAT
ncbi:MAG: hypothetical protein M0Q19_06680, partial [Candidatus Cloacimonetes bacterium]|nr:hypothetical protein [Candidatus Cloacimonadota bacterium]